ncbi:hypothetical protein CLUG_01859 [Clavispora lusitaniae ATCC 42720]|uniref:Uncharacterized protein n=1 Tax=Clavispora lusitaniae (strain ATCC 42720) TaxID=306902 RepID=C4Y0X7_CLAL4|nr:uncharacterized protein CLUG_01859 [Clavispora lusitaniae ATCC 42720]EEQ37736.1 hypothetical protein CLUG_01859 [Clavispora lusitaniae ATCC 42720]KAF5211926.1 hypothetical protein E0198_001472 [Clavispora lusitaniae]
MSENLKRAESLFNRIMNPNKPQQETRKTSNSNNYRQNNGSSHTHSNGSNNSHHRHSYKYNRYNHTNTPAASVVADLPKRNPAQEAADAVALLSSSEHVLPYCWAIWHHSRTKRVAEENNDDASSNNSTKTKGADSYLQNTTEIEFPQYGHPDRKIKTIASLEQMWLSLSTLKKSYNLAYGTELLVFKAGVNPVWEDPNNAKGGRWVFRFNHRNNSNSLSDDYQETVRAGRRRATLIWERLLLKTLAGSIIPEQAQNKVSQMLGDIVGLVLSVRRDEEIISVWNSNLHFGRKTGDDDDDRKKLTPFQARRVICDAVLRVIRECDVILQGSDCIETVAGASTERVSGVTFEYRLHSDSFSLYGSGDRRRGGKHHHSREKEEQEKDDQDNDDENNSAEKNGDISM